MDSDSEPSVISKVTSGYAALKSSRSCVVRAWSSSDAHTVSFTVSVVAAIRFATGSSEDAAELSAEVSAAAVSVAAELSAAVLSAAAVLSVVVSAAVELSAEEAPPASFPEFPHPTRLAATMDVASNAANTFFFITFSSLSLILFIALYKMCCHILYHLYQNFLRNRVAYFFVNFRFKVNLTPKKAFCQPSIHRSHIFLHFLTDF